MALTSLAASSSIASTLASASSTLSQTTSITTSTTRTTSTTVIKRTSTPDLGRKGSREVGRSLEVGETNLSPIREKLMRFRRSITEPLFQYFHELQMVSNRTMRYYTLRGGVKTSTYCAHFSKRGRSMCCVKGVSMRAVDPLSANVGHPPKVEHPQSIIYWFSKKGFTKLQYWANDLLQYPLNL